MGTSRAVPVRLRDDNDDDDDSDGDGDGYDDDADDDDDDDDDTGTGGPPHGFGSSGGHDYFPTIGASTPIYHQYRGGRGSGSGGGGGGHVGCSATGGSRRDKGKNIIGHAEEYNIGEIGGDMSSLYLHNNDGRNIHNPLHMTTQDSSSIDSLRYSMDHANRYGEYAQSDMTSQLAISLFEGDYNHYQYQEPEHSEEYSYYQDPPQKSFWW